MLGHCVQTRAAGSEAEPDWLFVACPHRGRSSNFNLLIRELASQWLGERKALDRPLGTHVGSETVR